MISSVGPASARVGLQQTPQQLQRGQTMPSQQQQQQQQQPQAGPPLTQRRGSKDQTDINSISGATNPFSQPSVGPTQTSGQEPQQNAPQMQTRPGLFRRSSQTSKDESRGDEVDDTMRNLRKTFAGIFGDMWTILKITYSKFNSCLVNKL